MRHSTFVACTAIFAGVAVVLFLGAGSPRVHTVKYSDDGKNWATSFRSTFFDNDIRWVPGDSRESRFHVFNDTDRDGRLRLTFDSDNPAFLRALSVSIGGGEPVESCAWIDLGAGQKKRIDATIAMAEAAGNDTRSSSAAVDLVVQWDNSNSAECPESSGARTDMEGAQP
ncbi:hypothetical protein CH272_14285 [Rhodococcus sp. 05-340-1]|uniref:hypothetical protein n=1 Tax=unclassified Rhodococcus (in: high G+C Gram-positive bacteria) TaxID=192944 RepID=UPI000B9C10B0|nr:MULTISPECIES: hypothetical protein [unclassified Rhodococcus (in: high G+C Gram-positive bacteria)]OZD72422.1 hypothetical protein CH271_02835 [Rhodococcus sp. 05-340-2]OZD76106.1 hypothetical protein CH272_14285 [Rhodococcus sp. 05-340-1]